ncbi:sugar phosphate isomerase/epimerase family protein [Pseudomonas sp. nanlin1]|uniref:sugar phosphate isomerase/epimerase family protein n=1 Tax=Pseudomonas sp. nanlin1 TaxID=3040605 RepID=UPI003890AA91
MNLSPVSISLSSYGADLVSRLGQAHFAPLLQQAGATHLELREELFVQADLRELKHAISDHGLIGVYSSPLEIWQAGLAQPNPLLREALANAQACGAIWLKVSLGFFSPHCDLQALDALLVGQPVHLLIENDQTPQGGRIEPLLQFFDAAAALALKVGMTFDIGNWQWQAQSVNSAALQLGSYVEYVHCKAVHRNAQGKLIATPPGEVDLRLWAQLFERLPQGVVRAIEYPLQGADLALLTHEHVGTLARLAHAEVSHG